MRSQRGPPGMPGIPGGRGGVGVREELNADKSLVPSSALSFPSSIIFKIFIRSSELAMVRLLIRYKPEHAHRLDRLVH